MNEQPISLPEFGALHDAVTAAIKVAIPQLRHVEAYPVLEEGMKMPALLYAMTNMAPGPNPGDGRVCVVATFEACILVESGRKHAPLQALILAGKLLALLDEQYWDLAFVDHAYDGQAMPAESIPDLVQCAAWSVQWRQNVYLGDSAWPWPDELPGVLAFTPGLEGEPAGLEASP